MQNPEDISISLQNTNVIAKTLNVIVPTHTNEGKRILYYNIELNKRIIGGFILNEYLETKRNASYNKTVLYIREIYIETNYQRKGIGRKVINLIIKDIKFKKPHIHSIQLEAHNSEPFWSKLGFKTINEISKDNDQRMIYVIQ